MNRFSTGDRVIYRREKHSTNPGPRAKNIDPAPLGEFYSYEVDKFWAVKAVEPTAVVLITRRGKTHKVNVTDPRLRRANWWERFFYSEKFPPTGIPSAGL